MTQPVRFRDPNVSASRQVGIKLLREVLDYQRRIDAIVDAGAADPGLLAAYRRAIRVRRELLRDLSIRETSLEGALPAA